MSSVRLAAVLTSSLALAACSPRAATPSRSAALERLVAADPPAFARDAGVSSRPIWRSVRDFYQKHDFTPVWSDGRKARPAMDALARALRDARDEGLDPQRYGADDIAAFVQHPESSRADETDARCTWAFLQYARDVTVGATAPGDVDHQGQVANDGVDIRASLDEAIATGHVEESLRALAPASPQYQALKHQLAMHPDDDRIRANMDRWRWLPRTLGDRYLIVNIPAYRLDAVEHDRSVLSMKVVVGTKTNPTPVLADRMTTIVFSPYWNIPDDIARREIQPKVAQDPDYLDRHNMEYDDEGKHFRQRPGPGNSLGFVKFLFPNHYNVYLHDTPAKSFFDRVERDFSHGCVRLERPMDLAQYVLRDRPEWTAARIDEAMHRGVEQSIPLKTPLPVYLVYFTAWEESGELQTAPDLYGLDQRQQSVAARR